MQVAPRHSIYVSSETTGAFIVDATLSSYHGAPFEDSTYNTGLYINSPFTTLYFSIVVEDSDDPLVQNNVTVDTTGSVFDFDLSPLIPRMEPYRIVLYAASEDGNQSYTATTELFYLPDKPGGSVTKVDNLNGNLLFRNNNTAGVFTPVFPYGFYTNYGGYLVYNLSNADTYASYGFNTIHPIASYSDNVTVILSYFDEINLLFQYDMRGTYQNLTSVTEQVALAKDYSSLLLWYTADEPDGNQDPLNGTTLAYNTIAALDKYHPVSLVLNCKNYYFEPYAAGTDILMEDAYPIGINATFSKWGTVCNSTYGDCGCDDCAGELSDVSDRIDAFSTYQDWLGGLKKPTWAVPQSFHGEGYWSRDPTVEETWVMNQLAVNHGAKGIMLWTFPTTDELATANGQQAKVLQVDPVLGFLAGTQPVKASVEGFPLLDLAYWAVGGQAMIGVANLDYADGTGSVTVQLPFDATAIASQPWGSLAWSLVNGSLVVENLPALVTSLLVLDL